MRDIQLQRRTEDALQERVVEVSRNPGAFLQTLLKALVELLCALKEPNAVEHHGSHPQRQQAEYAEVPRLPECGVDGKGEICFRSIPISKAIGSHDPEGVTARRKVRVDDLAQGSAITPAAVRAIQAITKLDALGHRHVR